MRESGGVNPLMKLSLAKRWRCVRLGLSLTKEKLTMATPEKPSAPKAPESVPEVKSRKVTVKDKNGRVHTVSKDYFQKYQDRLTLVK